MRLRRAAGLIAILNLALIFILSGKPHFTNASRPPRGIANPVVALEVARDVEEVDAILGEAPSPDREVMRVKQYIDFAFIASYAALYVTLSLLWGSRLAMVAAICGVAAAIFDVIENIAILRVCDAKLSQTTQAMVDAIRYPSLAKWTLAFAAIAILSGFFFAQKRRWVRAIGVINLIAAAVGFFGLYDNAFLVWAGLPMVAGIAATAVALLVPWTTAP